LYHLLLFFDMRPANQSAETGVVLRHEKVGYDGLVQYLHITCGIGLQTLNN